MTKAKVGDLVRIIKDGMHAGVPYLVDQIMYVFYLSDNRDFVYVRHEVQNKGVYQADAMGHALLTEDEYEVLQEGDYVRSSASTPFMVNKENLDAISRGSSFVAGYYLTSLKYTTERPAGAKEYLFDKVKRLYPKYTMFKTPFEPNTGEVFTCDGEPYVLDNGNICVPVVPKGRLGTDGACVFHKATSKWGEILEAVGGRFLQAFPTEGSCWSTDRRLIKYLYDRPYEGGTNRDIRPDAKGVAWGPYSYWYLITDKGSSKSLYTLEELEPFLPLIEEKDLECHEVQDYYFELESTEEYDLCKEKLNVATSLAWHTDWRWLVPYENKPGAWTLTCQKPMVLKPKTLTEAGIILPPKKEGIPTSLLGRKIWVGDDISLRIEVIIALEKKGFHFHSTLDRQTALTEARCIFTFISSIGYNGYKSAYDASNHKVLELEEIGIFEGKGTKPDQGAVMGYASYKLPYEVKSFKITIDMDAIPAVKKIQKKVLIDPDVNNVNPVATKLIQRKSTTYRKF